MSSNAPQTSRAEKTNRRAATKKSTKQISKDSVKTTKKAATKSALSQKKTAKTATKSPVVKKAAKTLAKAASVAKQRSAAKKPIAAKQPAAEKKTKPTLKSAILEKTPVSRKRAKSVLVEQTIVSPATPDESVLKKRGRKAKSAEMDSTESKAKTPRKKHLTVKSLTEEFLEEATLIIVDDDDLDPNLVDLDPLDAPVVLDPEIIDSEPLIKPRPAAPPKPKTGKLAPRTHTCARCGGKFPWISAEKLCFSCVKKNIAQKRSDDTFSGIVEDIDGPSF
jgi:hypothetical protein